MSAIRRAISFDAYQELSQIARVRGLSWCYELFPNVADNLYARYQAHATADECLALAQSALEILEIEIDLSKSH